MEKENPESLARFTGVLELPLSVVLAELGQALGVELMGRAGGVGCRHGGSEPYI